MLLPNDGFRYKMAASPEGNRMVRKLIRNQSLRKQLRVRLPCPPLSQKKDPQIAARSLACGFLLAFALAGC
jgi:hypothetical protein